MRLILMIFLMRNIMASLGLSPLLVKFAEDDRQFLKKCIDEVLKCSSVSGTETKTIVNLNIKSSFPLIRRAYNEEFIQIDNSPRSDTIVISLENLTYIELTKLSHHYGPHLKYVLITFEDPSEEIFATMLNYNVFDFIVIEYNESSTMIQNIYTSFPFTHRNMNDMDPSAVLLDQCKDGNLVSGIDLFPNKIPATWDNSTIWALHRDAHPYVVLVGPFSGMGYDTYLLELIADKLKFKLKFKIFTASELEKNMFNNSIAMGALSWKKNLTPSFEISHSHIQDELVWLVPRSARMRSSKRLMNIFSKQVWIYLFVTFVVLGLIYGKFSYWITKKRDDDLVKVYMTLFQVITVNSTKLPTRTFLRAVLLLWIFGSLIVCSIFSGNIISILNKQKYEHQIDTAKQLKASNLIMASFEKNDLENSTNTERCDDMQECVSRIADKKDYAVMFWRRFADIQLLQHSKQGESLLYIIPEPVVQIPLFYYICKGSPYADQMNKLIDYTLDYGIHRRYFRSMETHINKQFLAYKRQAMKSNNLNLEKLALAFKLLIFGWGVCFIIFCIEMLPSKFQNNL